MTTNTTDLENLDAAIATEVMGFIFGAYQSQCEITEEYGTVTYWLCQRLGRTFWKWSPTTNANHMRLVLEKIRELGLWQQVIRELDRLGLSNEEEGSELTAWRFLTAPLETQARAALAAVRGRDIHAN